MHPKNWKGGRYIDQGYWWIWVGTGKHRQEHRVLMEKHLGRPLRPDEDVHHINEDKLDNRIENLEVINHGEHARKHRTGKKQPGKGGRKPGPIRYADCHPDRVHLAKGKCQECYYAGHSKRWAEKNPERLKEHIRAKYKENPEYYKELSRNYRKKNLEKVRQKEAESRARRREKLAKEKDNASSRDPLSITPD